MLIIMNSRKENDIEEELTGATKYYSMFGENGDIAYKEMASDELKHAGILIKKHLAKSVSEKERAKLNAYEKERQDMLKKMSVVKPVEASV